MTAEPPVEHDFSASVLGETTARVRVDTAAENLACALSMARQCRRLLDISSRHLDPMIYDTAEFVAAVRELARRSRYTQIRILVHSPGQLVARGHRLLEVAQALSSFIQVRVPGDEHRDFNEAMLIADRCGYIHRPLADRHEAAADFNDPQTCTDLLRRFDIVWEAADPDPNFRRLHV